MTQLTVTGPFVNKTLFEQAESPCPGRRRPGTTGRRRPRPVADKTPFPIAIDRSGHRVFGMVISQGGKVFDAKGEPGHRRRLQGAARKFFDWHKAGVMSSELWGSVGGATYRGANDEFKNGQVVLYLSGSWQIAQFDKTIGNAFDWVAVPNPCGPEDAPACPAAPACRDQEREGPGRSAA